jgi:hypothetical protein
VEAKIFEPACFWAYFLPVFIKKLIVNDLIIKKTTQKRWGMSDNVGSARQ